MCLRCAAKRSLLILLLVALPVSAGFSSEGPHTVRIGVLAERGLNHCRAKWHPTAVYLSKILVPHQFVIVPLDLTSMPKAVADKKIEFIIN
ncbi:MAG: hypothetical protein PVJ19_23380, partial [Desulfobacteraceae bacterium]